MRRLGPGVLILGVFAILLGLVAAYGVKRYLSQPAPQVVTPEPPKVDTLVVPLSVADLPAGRTIVATDIISVPMTRVDALKAGLPAEFMDKVSQIVGRTLRRAVPKRQSFEPSMFYPTGMGPDVTEDLKPGERAVTIPFRKDSPDLVHVTPGAHVDVLFRINPDASAQVSDATVTLLSKVRVLAIGTNSFPGSTPVKDKAAPDKGEGQTVTLAVSETQAKALKVVEGRGTMMLAQRSLKDEQPAEKGGPTTLPGLLGLKEPVTPFVSEVYRAGHYSAMTFRDGQRQKIKIDPPYGMPIGDVKNPNEDIELWPFGYGYGYGGYGANVGAWNTGGHGSRIGSPNGNWGGGGWGGGWGGGGWGGGY